MQLLERFLACRPTEPCSDDEEAANLAECGSPYMNTIKSLPGPEGFREEGKKEVKKSRDDLLNLGDSGQTVEYADKVGIAFFDGGLANQQPSLPNSPEVTRSQPRWQCRRMCRWRRWRRSKTNVIQRNGLLLP
ncbi:hypothetical protein L1887_20801 [Cichorium endivia]|nr:hypothetical protein L1887_20801 [Cichorium endivia]